MNINKLQEVWASQQVIGNQPDVARLMKQLRHEAQQRSRRVRRITAIATFVMIIGLAVGLAAHLTGIRTFTPTTLATFLGGMLLNAGVVIFAVRVHRRVQREYLDMAETLAESLRASLTSINRQIRDCAMAGYALGVVALAQIIITFVHYSTGNLPLKGVIGNVALTLLFAIGIAVTLRRYVRQNLVPRREELRREVAGL